MKDAKPIKTPMGTNGHLDLDTGGKFVYQKVYRSMIGFLLYLCASPPTQDEDQAQDNEDEDQEDEPPQEEDNDQWGDEDKEDDQEIQGQRPPHPRVHQAIQRDHPVNSILGDIHKGVTTRSRVAHFVNITLLCPLLSHTG